MAAVGYQLSAFLTARKGGLTKAIVQFLNEETPDVVYAPDDPPARARAVGHEVLTCDDVMRDTGESISKDSCVLPSPRSLTYASSDQR